MNHSHPIRSRRDYLKRMSLMTAGALGSGTFANLVLPGRDARAADYKALVCVFLYGGNDGLNTIVPTDSDRYGKYSSVRKTLAIPKSSLIPLTTTDYGLHPALASLGKAWTDKRLATVFNVGPLQTPLTKDAYISALPNAQNVPHSLFSHSDQQVLWETATADSLTRAGWGGRASEVLGTTNPVISVGGNGRFGLSSGSTPLVIPEPGTLFGAQELSQANGRLAYLPYAARANALTAMYRQVQQSDLAEAYAQMQRDAFNKSALLAGMVKTQPGDSDANAAINAGFSSLISGGKITTPLGRQLYQAAKFIANNGILQGTRQIYFASLGGFDTHGDQIGANPVQGNHANLLKQLGDALAAFDAAMTNLGMGDAVTTFTQSDFGRTFKPNNSSGTDHAWGNNHLIIGGAVKGGSTYGTYPELTLGGKDDVSADGSSVGRWIPTSSVDQYASTLLRWFGASEAQLDSILPNLKNFGSKRQLGFL